jgi:hypothetical protein
MSRIVTVSLIATVMAGGLALAAAAQPPAGSPPQPGAQEKVDYSKPYNWLCLPGRQDACTVDLTATVIQANGKVKEEKFVSDPNAPIDCFYVYPTVSRDPGGISDLIPQADQEGRTVKGQFARLGAKCRLFAPMYRQATLAAIGRAPAPAGGAAPARGATPPAPPPAAAPARGAAQARPFDALDAWNWYMANENKGRGVVIMGHSQGSGVITRLIAQEIDGKPAQKQLISAIILGTAFQVPKGKDVGGTFKSIPVCHSAKQFGCVVTWSTYRDTLPPAKAQAKFGVNRGEGMEAACTNPATLLKDGAGRPKSYWANPSNNIVWNKDADIKTPFVSTPGLVTTQCVRDEGHHYLQIHVNADPKDPRSDKVYGDVMTAGKADDTWGMHLADANEAMGNILEIVQAQGKAWLKANKKK